MQRHSKIRLGVVMDPIQHIHFDIDTSLGILNAVQSRGWEIYYLEQKDLYLNNGIPYGDARLLTVFLNKNKWFELSHSQSLPLTDLNAILIRLEPPFNSEYLYTTLLLEQAERLGLFVMNRPQGLRDCNEKLFAMEFPHCMPPTLVAQSLAHLQDFLAQHKDIVCKPLDGMGGNSIYRIKQNDSKADSIFRQMTKEESIFTMVQTYLPEIQFGDKRILIFDGEPLPHVLARVPQGEDGRGNLCHGAKPEPRPLTERDQYICSEVGPELRKRGIYLAGLDVIGDYLTEINVTSPACIRPLDDILGTNYNNQLIDLIEKKIV